MTGEADDFEALVRQKAREAVTATEAWAQEASRERGELYTLLAKTQILIEQRSLQAARSVGERHLRREARQSGNDEVLELTWSGPGPTRTLRLHINLDALSLTWQWYVPDGGPSSPERVVRHSEFGTFDPKELILKLIQAEPWIFGQLPS
jgi:hypothetical protein